VGSPALYDDKHALAAAMHRSELAHMLRLAEAALAMGTLSPRSKGREGVEGMSGAGANAHA
jgi:hypothetical protein